MLDIENSCLVVVDVQGKLAQLMYDKETLFKNVCILIKAAKLLDIPIVWTQQCPESLGGTTEKIAELLTDVTPINKAAFSCCRQQGFVEQLRRQVILCGIETHICIYQTAVDLLQKDHHIEIVSDAVSSRTAENKAIGLAKIKTAGAQISCVETVLFELLKTAQHRQFKEIVKMIK
ncbi:MAG: isochorismatase family protein [Planctomycetota bacterium]|jgi:nicotinamidase-related amidase